MRLRKAWRGSWRKKITSFALSSVILSPSPQNLTSASWDEYSLNWNYSTHQRTSKGPRFYKSLVSLVESPLVESDPFIPRKFSRWFFLRLWLFYFSPIWFRKELSRPSAGKKKSGDTGNLTIGERTTNRKRKYFFKTKNSTSYLKHFQKELMFQKYPTLC